MLYVLLWLITVVFELVVLFTRYTATYYKLKVRGFIKLRTCNTEYNNGFKLYFKIVGGNKVTVVYYKFQTKPAKNYAPFTVIFIWFKSKFMCLR